MTSPTHNHSKHGNHKTEVEDSPTHTSCAGKHIPIHVKRLLLLSGLNQDSKVSTNNSKISQYQLPQNCVQRLPSCRWSQVSWHISVTFNSKRTWKRKGYIAVVIGIQTKWKDWKNYEKSLCNRLIEIWQSHVTVKIITFWVFAWEPSQPKRYVSPIKCNLFHYYTLPLYLSYIHSFIRLQSLLQANPPGRLAKSKSR